VKSESALLIGVRISYSSTQDLGNTLQGCVDALPYGRRCRNR